MVAHEQTLAEQRNDAIQLVLVQLEVNKHLPVLTLQMETRVLLHSVSR